MNSKITKSEDSTIKLTITVPWKDIEKIREKVIDELSKSVNAPGFRKGNVPKNIAKQKLDKEKVNEETLKKALPEAYINAVKENNINPIINPKVHIEVFDEGTDLIFSAETSEEPQTDLKNYKEEIKKVTAKSKIIIPGKTAQKPNMDEVINALIKSTEVRISLLLIEQETNRLLSQFLDELKTLGLSLDQYLVSKGKKPEDLRKEYEEKAQKDLKIEFLLRKIADNENIVVEQKDINEVLNKITDENQKKEMEKNIYLLSAIIRQQKTLDFLSNI